MRVGATGPTLQSVRARDALWSLVGPGVFALASEVGARIEPGYRRRDEPISALAARARVRPG